jgi:hypothetical protein
MEILRLREELESDLKGRRKKSSGPRGAPTRPSAPSIAGESSWTVREKDIGSKERGIAEQEGRLKGRQDEIAALVREQQAKLERVAGLTAEDARREVMQRAEDEARGQAQALARDIKEQAKKGADKEARRIIANATQRLAAETTAETTVAAVPLPNRRNEGPHHRPRRPEHPRLRDRDRRRRHHRRHARYRGHLLLRPDPPRDRATRARGADHRRADPARTDRGNRRQEAEGDARPRSWSWARPRRSRSASTGCTPS